MSTKPSEQMLDLLKELALLKEMDATGESAIDPAKRAARENRRREITEQIKALGAPST